ncbi:MAG: nuclear transport factor 2 family protein [Pseudomonadota bacterium]
MDTQAIAEDFTRLMRENKDAEAQEKYWSDDVVSLEAGDGQHQRCEGRAAVLEKHKWWNENAEMHGGSIEGPMVNGDMFVVKFSMDVTMKGMDRMQMDEVALYTVKDGKIVEERFFYPTDEV